MYGHRWWSMIPRVELEGMLFGKPVANVRIMFQPDHSRRGAKWSPDRKIQRTAKFKGYDGGVPT
jgi:hypothetical protein